MSTIDPEAAPASEPNRPALLCYDGSEPAAHAIEQAAAVLGGGPAVVLVVWESLAAAVLRAPIPRSTELGREMRGISEDVVDALDAGVAEDAQRTAAEGAELADRAGFDARPLARRALGRSIEPTETTVWHAVLSVAADESARVIVVGARGRSAVAATVLGSVSYGLVHHSDRPVLTVTSAA